MRVLNGCAICGSGVWAQVPSLFRACGLDVLAFSLLTALAAQAAVHLPFSPVPVTGQTLMVLLAGALLGRKRGAAAMAAYLAEGACGLPVFAAGAFGIPHLLGPAAGYLLAFLPAAWVVGALVEKGWDRGLRAAAAFFMGSMLLLSCGSLGLLRFMPLSACLWSGFLLFVTGEVLKIGAAVSTLAVFRK